MCWLVLCAHGNCEGVRIQAEKRICACAMAFVLLFCACFTLFVSSSRTEETRDFVMKSDDPVRRKILMEVLK